MKEFSKDILKINVQIESERICTFLKKTILSDLRRQGAIVGLSGGIDSALVATLCVKAFGPEKVLGVILPEKDSSSVSEEYAYLLAKQLNIETVKIDLTSTLEAFGAYKNRDHVVSNLFPDFDPSTWRQLNNWYIQN